MTTYDWLALPGIPAGSGAWEKLPVRTQDYLGLETDVSRKDWHLDSFVAEILPAYDHNTILIGQDLGGVLASMATLQQKPKAVVLTGTALGSWWYWTRLSAKSPFHLFFYHTFKGNLFTQLGGGTNTRKHFSGHPHQSNPEGMRRLATHMRPPKGLAQHLTQQCPVFLIWGQREVFYPLFTAKRLAKQTNAPLFLNRGGHYCMWTHHQEFKGAMKQIENLLHR